MPRLVITTGAARAAGRLTTAHHLHRCLPVLVLHDLLDVLVSHGCVPRSIRGCCLRCAARRSAATGGLGKSEADGALIRWLDDFVLEVVVQVIDLPLDPVRILHPELVLVGVT